MTLKLVCFLSLAISQANAGFLPVSNARAMTSFDRQVAVVTSLRPQQPELSQKKTGRPSFALSHTELWSSSLPLPEDFKNPESNDGESSVDEARVASAADPAVTKKRRISASARALFSTVTSPLTAFRNVQPVQEASSGAKGAVSVARRRFRATIVAVSTFMHMIRNSRLAKQIGSVPTKSASFAQRHSKSLVVGAATYMALFRSSRPAQAAIAGVRETSARGGNLLAVAGTTTGLVLGRAFVASKRVASRRRNATLESSATTDVVTENATEGTMENEEAVIEAVSTQPPPSIEEDIEIISEVADMGSIEGNAAANANTPPPTHIPFFLDEVTQNHATEDPKELILAEDIDNVVADEPAEITTATVTDPKASAGVASSKAGVVEAVTGSQIGKRVLTSLGIREQTSTVDSPTPSAPAPKTKSKSMSLPFRKSSDQIAEARRQPKPPAVEAALAAKYAAIESLEERAYQILLDLGMVGGE